MSFDFDWCRCGEHMWPHWHVNPDDRHEIEVLGEDDENDPEEGAPPIQDQKRSL